MPNGPNAPSAKSREDATEYDDAEDGSEDYADPSDGQSKRKRRMKFTRVRAACERCKTRKQKCDLQRPQCSNCQKSDSECVVVDAINQSRWRPRHESLENRIAQLEAALLDRRAGSSVHAHETHPLNPESLDPSPAFSVDPRQREASLSLAGFTHHYLRFAQHDSEGGADLSLRLPGRLPRPRRVIPLPIPSNTNKLVSAFFSSRWVNYPILMQHDFLATIANPASSGLLVDDRKRFLIYMVVAVALIDSPLDQHDLMDFYDTAVTFYLEPLMAVNDLETLQGLMLLAVFAMSDPRGLSLWHLVGIIMRIAVDLGYHQLNPSIGSWKDELKVRVFWSVFVYDRSVGVALARPMSINVNDISTPMPSLVDDPSSPLDLMGERKIRAFIHTIRLRVQNGLNSSLLNVSAVMPTFMDRPWRLDAFQLGCARTERKAILDQWLIDAPTYDTPTTCTYTTPEWFEIAHAYALLVLYRPTSAYPISSYEDSRQCANASMKLIASYLRLYTHAKVTYTWVALHSLFMATLTAHYVLQQSSDLRRMTTYETVQINMRGCAIILGAMATQWPYAKSYQMVCESLTTQTLACFEKDASTSTDGSQIDRLWIPSPLPATGGSDDFQGSSAGSNAFTNLQSDLDDWLATLTSQQPDSASRAAGPTCNFDQAMFDQSLAAWNPLMDEHFSAADLDALLRFHPG